MRTGNSTPNASLALHDSSRFGGCRSSVDYFFFKHDAKPGEEARLTGLGAGGSSNAPGSDAPVSLKSGANGKDRLGRSELVKYDSPLVAPTLSHPRP